MELSGAISRCHGPLGESSDGPSSSIEQKLLALPGVLLPSTSSKAANDSLSKLLAMSFADWMLRKCSNHEQSRSFASLAMHLVVMTPKNGLTLAFAKILQDRVLTRKCTRMWFIRRQLLFQALSQPKFRGKEALHVHFGMLRKG